LHLDRLTVVSFVALVLAVILHEISHGVVALWFGDDTAKRAGRLTLNPVPHIDPFGSLIIPALLAFSGAPVIGWAKPVPVNPARLRNSRRSMLFVSLAGPVTNFLLAAAAAVLARALYHPTGQSVIFFDRLPLTVLFPLWFAVVNVLLGIFNFLPIPPLDGAALIERVLPQDWLSGWYQFRQYGMLVLFVLVFWLHLGDRIFTPVLDHVARFVLA
jgi:Zn-dependent protease